MPKSTFIFEEGDPIDVGAHGEHEYVFAEGTPVRDSGKSTFVFESGTGLGGGDVVYGKLTPNPQILPVGQATTLAITATSRVESDINFTTDFQEDTEPDDLISDFGTLASETQTVPAAESVTYQTDVSRNSAQANLYRALGTNEASGGTQTSNEVRVAWLNFSVTFSAAPNPADLSQNEEDVTLSLEATNESSQSRDLEVTFIETDAVDTTLSTTTETFAAGETKTLTETVTETEPAERFFYVEVREVGVNVTGRTADRRVNWVQDLAEQTVSLSASDSSTNYFGGGRDWAAGEYRIEVDNGRYTVWGFGVPVRYECDGVLDEDERTWVYHPCNLTEGGDQIGPFIEIGGSSTRQTNVLTTKRLGGTTGSGEGTFELATDGQIGVRFQDLTDSFADNRGTLTYTIYQI